MKKIYYPLLVLALFLLLQPLTLYVVLQHHMEFYGPYLKEEGDYEILQVPDISEEKREELLLRIHELAQEKKLTVGFQSYDTQRVLSKADYGDTVLMYYATGRSKRLEKLPFSVVPSLEEFQKSSQLYSSSPDTPNPYQLKAPSQKYTFYLGNLLSYPGNLQKGKLFILDATEATIDAFKEEIETKTGVSLQSHISQSLLKSLARDSKKFYLEHIKVSFSGRRLLLISLIGIAMLVYYLSRKKSWSVQRMFGYSLMDLLASLLRVMMAPTVVLALVSFIPFCLILGMRLGYCLEVFFAFLPVLGVFLLFQFFVVLLMILDQALSSPLATLQDKKNHHALLGFGFVFKAISLVLIFPVLIFNVMRVGNILDYSRVQREAKTLYADVWVLSSLKADANLSSVDVEGKFRVDPWSEESLSWLKAFYDEIRDHYPVFWVEARPQEDPQDVRSDLLLVNGNFVRLMKLKDEKGKLLLPDNEEKMVLATQDRVKQAKAYLATTEGKATLLYESTKAFDKKFLLDPSQTKGVDVLGLEEGSSVLSFQPASLSEESKLPAGRLKTFTLGVNARYSPNRLEELCFVGISEQEREKLLEEVAHLPYTEQLFWQPYLESHGPREAIDRYEIKETFTNLVTGLMSSLVAAFFLFYSAYDAMGRRWAVLYLFGHGDRNSSLVLLGVLLLLDFACYALSGYIVPDYYPEKYKVYVLFFFVGIDLLLYGVMKLIYRKKTLKSLRVR